MAKKELRRQARNLRKKGKTYQEIRKVIPVSKSTLSLWLRDLPRPKRTRNASLAGEANKKRWSRIRQLLLEEDTEEFASYELNRNAVTFIGAALYWAEGQKRVGFNFANSDPFMIEVYLWWLRNIIEVDESDLKANIHVYLDGEVNYEEVLNFWSDLTGIEEYNFYSPQILTADVKKTQVRHVKVLKHGVLHLKVLSALKYRAKCAALLTRIGKKTHFVEANDLG